MEEKDHGEGGNFVGAKLRDGDRVVLIEDVVTQALPSARLCRS